MSPPVFLLLVRVERTRLDLMGEVFRTDMWSLYMLASSSWLEMDCFSGTNSC